MPESQIVKITKETTAPLADEIYKSCLKADTDGTQMYMLAEALDFVYKEISHAHQACGGSDFVLKRMKSLLPLMISKQDRFSFPKTLTALVDEVIQSIKPDHRFRDEPQS